MSSSSSSSDEIDNDLVMVPYMEISDNSLKADETTDDEAQVKSSKALPINPRQIKINLQKVLESIELMQMYAVYFESRFYIGQVQKMFYKCEDETPVNLTQVEVKYLSWSGDTKYKWPVKDEVEIINPVFIFEGPISTESFDPFVIPSEYRSRQLYDKIKRYRDDIFTEHSVRADNVDE